MSKASKIFGWIFSAAVSAVFGLGAFVQLSHNPRAVASMTKQGYRIGSSPSSVWRISRRLFSTSSRARLLRCLAQF